MRGIAGNEDTPILIGGRHRIAEVPETGVVDLKGELETRSIVERGAEIIVLAPRVFGDRRAALRSQYPMLALMLGYTMMSLWIIAQPIVSSRFG